MIKIQKSEKRIIAISLKRFKPGPPRTKMSWSGYRVIKQWSVRQNHDIFTTSLTNEDFQITCSWFQNFQSCTCHILHFV